MSDEQPQPSLRLKPRSAAAANPPTAPQPSAPKPVEPPVPEQPAAPIDPMHLRLKPKAPPPESPDTSGVTFATPQPFSNPLLPAAEVNPPTVPVANTPPPPLPPPVHAAPIAPPPAKTPYLPTPSGLIEPGRVPVAPSSKVQHTYKADKWLAAAVIFVLVLGGAIYGVRALMKANPKQKSAARASASTESKPAPAEPQPSTSGQPRLVDNPTSVAGKAVAKARDLVAAREKFDQEQGVDHVLAATPATPTIPENPSAGAVSINQPPAPVAPPPEPELPPIPPSDAFRQFVTSLRINGVFQGENARAMLNGKMYHLGEVVDAKLGITFYKFDVEAKNLVFRDENGAIVTRRF